MSKQSEQEFVNERIENLNLIDQKIISLLGSVSSTIKTLKIGQIHELKEEHDKNEEQKELMKSNIQDFYENFEYMVSRLRREIILVDKKTGFSAKEEGDVSLLSVFIDKKASWVGDWKFRNEVKKLKTLVNANEEEFMLRKEQEEREDQEKKIMKKELEDEQKQNLGNEKNNNESDEGLETSKEIKQEQTLETHDQKDNVQRSSIEPDIEMVDITNEPETVIKVADNVEKMVEDENKDKTYNTEKARESSSEKHVVAEDSNSEDIEMKQDDHSSTEKEANNSLPKMEESDSDADLFGETSMDDDDGK